MAADRSEITAKAWHPMGTLDSFSVTVEGGEQAKPGPRDLGAIVA